jgi:hypothetical protein
MTEYEWEIRRIPRAPDVRHLVGHYHHRKGPIAEYAALEFPRESVTWVAKPDPNHERGRSAGARPPTQKPGQKDELRE